MRRSALLARFAGARLELVHAVDPDRPQALVDEHLEELYGSRAGAVLARADGEPRLLEPLCEHTGDVLAQVAFAVEREHARRLEDVLFRRLTVGFAACEGRDAVGAVAGYMADLLGWDDGRRRAEVERYEAVLERRHAWKAELASADPD